MSTDRDPRDRMRRHLIQEIQKRRKEKLGAAYEDAARDPAFIQEMFATDDDGALRPPMDSI